MELIHQGLSTKQKGMVVRILPREELPDDSTAESATQGRARRQQSTQKAQVPTPSWRDAGSSRQQDQLQCHQFLRAFRLA